MATPEERTCFSPPLPDTVERAFRPAFSPKNAGFSPRGKGLRRREPAQGQNHG
jgi:hypothetical protein